MMKQIQENLAVSQLKIGGEKNKNEEQGNNGNEDLSPIPRTFRTPKFVFNELIVIELTGIIVNT